MEVLKFEIEVPDGYAKIIADVVAKNKAGRYQDAKDNNEILRLSIADWLKGQINRHELRKIEATKPVKSAEVEALSITAKEVI